MRGFTTLKIIVGLFFVIAIIVAVYFFTAEKVRAPVQEENVTTTTQQTPSDSLPEGVSVIEKDGKRVLRDERVGYEMQIPEDVLVEGIDENIVFYVDKNIEGDGSVLGGIGIDNRDELSLEAWVARLHKQTTLVFYDEREKINKGGLEIIKVRVDGPGEQYSYFLPYKNKIIYATFIDDVRLDSYIQNIKFFE